MVLHYARMVKDQANEVLERINARSGRRTHGQQTSNAWFGTSKYPSGTPNAWLHNHARIVKDVFRMVRNVVGYVRDVEQYIIISINYDY